jgi:signal transduction histidine kinase
MSGTRTARVRIAATLILAATGALAAVTTQSAVAWIGRPFPGFFLLRNRVVASVSLPGWPVALAPDVFQATVLAVDELPVTSSEEVYARVRSRPVGTRFAYTFQHDRGSSMEWMESRLFTWRDAILIFGAYLLNGLVFAAIGVGVWALSPRRATPWALLGVCLALSTYILTAMDLNGPHRFFRLHGLAECFLPGALLHLAFLFPVRRAHALRAAAVSYLPASVLALVYQLRLDSPRLYTGVHAAATLWLVAGAVVLLGAAVWGYVRAPSELVRHRVRVAVLGLLLGLVIPVALFTVSLFENGRVPVNMTAFTAFVFPLSIAYAVHKRDLFQVDGLVQRGFYYAILSGLVTGLYLAVTALATHVLHISRLGQSHAFSLAFTLAALIVLPRVRDRVQQVVDLIFGRRTYDAQEILGGASAALGATLRLDEILHITLSVPAKVLGLDRVTVFLRGDGGFEEAASQPARPPGYRPVRLGEDRPLARLLSRLQPIVADAFAGETGARQAACRADFDALDAALIVPLGGQGAVTGFLVCGRNRGGTFFSSRDVSFLHAFANQAALSLQNARTFRDLEVLNADLERRVNERTGQLASSTEQLSASLEQLGAAYRTLQASQEQLVAAQKMAAFGRLVAGLAHEMNTPLGAALNGLMIARELVAECETATGDPDASPADRRAAFAELATAIASVEQWTRKAVDYIRSVKAQSHASGGAAAAFDLGRLLERDLQPLLMHRLRLVGGTLELRLAPELPELYGDPSRLGQALANLINNAIDACEGLAPERTLIVVEALREDQEVVLHVRDRGTGIRDDDRDRIFDDFYTTKPPGKGTGLGLSIARSIVAGEFGGTLSCSASSTTGTTFTMRFPLDRERPSTGDRPKRAAA